MAKLMFSDKIKPYLLVVGSQSVASSPSGRDLTAHISIVACRLCSARNLRDILALCLCAAFPVNVRPISVSLRVSHSDSKGINMLNRIAEKIKYHEPVTHLCNDALLLTSFVSRVSCNISVWRLEGWTMCRKMTWRRAKEPQWTDEIHPRGRRGESRSIMFLKAVKHILGPIHTQSTFKHRGSDNQVTRLNLVNDSRN